MAKKKIKRAKGEKLLYGILLFLVIAFPLSEVFSKAMLSKTNIEVESVRKKVNTQEQMNESLSMKINELASLDKIQKVATEQGLEYNNDNIKTVTE